MDEAVLRIVMQDDGGGTPGAGPPPSPPAGGGPPPPAGQPPTPPPAKTARPPKPPPRQKPVKSNLDVLLDVADALRGTIGGLAGTLAGLVLDVVSAAHKVSKDTGGVPTTSATTAAAKGASTAAASAAARGATSAAAGGGAAAAGGLAAIAGPLVVIAVAVVAAVKAMEALVNFADRAEQQFAEYSPQIAQAQAVAEIRQTLGDFRRAQQISAEMSKYVLAKSDLQQRYEDLKVRILTKILPALTRVMQFLEGMVPLAEAWVEVLLAPVKHISDTVDAIESLMPDFLKRDLEEIKDPTSILFMEPERGGVQVPQF